MCWPQRPCSASRSQPQTVPPPVIPTVVVPTNPPTPTRSATPGYAGPATRSVESLIIGQVVDTTGRPVPKAVVRLMGDRPIETVLADAKGRFYFRSIPLGEVIVTAQKVGYFDGGYGQRRASGLPLPFSVPFGQVMPNMKIELFRAAVITGSVIDAASEPAAGVKVVALRRQFVSGEWVYAAAGSAVTDDQGIYRIFGLPPGEYLATVPSADIGAPARSLVDLAAPDATSPPSVFPTMFYVATDHRILALPIALVPGQVRYAVNFTLPLVRTRRVTGHLAGEPAAILNQRISLLPVDAGWASPDEFATTESAPDGTFEFSRVPAGHYQLQAGNVSPAMRTGVPGGPLALIPPSFCGRIDVFVDDDNVELGEIEMHETASVTGEVLMERQAGSAGDSADPTGVAIVIEPAEPGLSRAATLYAGTNGKFSIANLIPGNYYIRTGQLPRGWFLRSITAGRDDALDDPVDLRGDDTALAVVLTTRGTEVIGTVRDARMQFAVGAAVIIVPVVADGRAIWTPNRIRETRTSTSGVFNVKGLPPGDYLVAAIDDATAEGWQDPKRLASLRQVATRFTLKAADTVSLVLKLR